MSDLHDMEIAELAALIAARHVSPVEVTRAQLDRIARRDGALHSFATVTAEHALSEAARAEAEINSGRRRGPLHGVPLGIKDLFWTKGVRTAGGTMIHRDLVPDRDATTVRRLRDAGAVILGKLQMTEGAYSDYHPSITPAVNPWSPDHWTGISSSGPAVAVAAGLCHGALASDTGGSIRWPAAATGLTGLKPTWGRVSRDGAIALAPSLDHVGTLTRSAADAGLLFAAIAGADPSDPTCLGVPVPEVSQRAGMLGGRRIGIDLDWNREGVDPVVRGVLDEVAVLLEGLGADIRPVTVPDVAAAIADWPDLCAVEASIVHERTFPSRRDEYGPVLAAVLDRGRHVGATDFHRIQLRREDLRRRFDALFAEIDLLLCPAHPFAPLSLAQIGTMGAQPELIAALQRYTVPFNMTGHPTLTLPGGQDDRGLPIGFQLVAAHGRDDLVIQAGMAFQGVMDRHRTHPKE